MDKHTKSLSFLFVWIIKEIAVQIWRVPAFYKCAIIELQTKMNI